MLALDRVDFEAHRGEIHALVGENGAGKTTLMNIIAGRMRPDDGDASLDGAALPSGSALAALQAGIAAVSQSPMLFERMTWEENLALGGFVRPTRLDLAAVTARARTLAEHLGFKLPPPGARSKSASMAERVRLEVLRALSFEPRVLILDEPTGVLAPRELTSFLDLLRRLRGEGRIIVLITHKLGEAIAVADRITVLRQGRVVMRTTPAETSEAELARLMIGELCHLRAAQLPVFTGAAHQFFRSKMYRWNAMAIDAGRRLASLRSGEIAGIAGVDGNGQTELVEILAGARRADSGEIRLPERTGAMAVIPKIATSTD